MMMLKAADEPIPGYKLVKFLGKGAFGPVWEATSPGQVHVALKFLDLSGKQGWKEFRGVQRIKKLAHPHLIPIIALWLLDEDGDILKDDVMESLLRSESKNDSLEDTMVPGESETIRDDHGEPRCLVVAQVLGDKTLGQRLEEAQRVGQTGIPPKELLRYMEESAKGIDFLNSAKHDFGEGNVSIQHCDIKPANILLMGDSAVICDFGVAQLLADSENAALATAMAGTPAYISPECIARRPSAGSDQYSLAITYYELRTGKLPFASEEYHDVMDAHRKGKLELSAVPASEQKVLRKATSVDPANRYVSASEMVRELRRAIEGKTPQGKSNSLVVIAALTVAVISLIALSLFLITPRDTREYTLVIGTSDAIKSSHVWIDGEEISLKEDGRYVFQRRPNTTVKLKVEAGNEYKGFEKEQDLSDQKEIIVNLDVNAAHFYKEAGELLDKGQDKQAISKLAIALQNDADSYAKIPSPVSLRGHKTATVSFDLADDGNHLVSGDEDGVAIWRNRLNVNDYQEFHSGKRILKTAVAGDKIVVWQLLLQEKSKDRVTCFRTAGNQVAKIFSLEDPGIVSAVELTNDGRWLVIGAAKDTEAKDTEVVEAWDLQATNIEDSKIRVGIHENQMMQMSTETKFERSRVFGAVTMQQSNNLLMEWIIGENKPAGKRIGEHDQMILCITSHDGKIAFGGEGISIDSPSDKQYEVTVYDEATQESSPHYNHVAAIESLSFSADGKHLASGSADGKVAIVTVGQADDMVLNKSPHTQKLTTTSFAPNYPWLITTGEEGIAALWKLGEPGDDASYIEFWKGEPAALQIRISDDGRYVFLGGTKDGDIRVFDLRRLKVFLEAAKKANVKLRIPNVGPRIEA